MQGPDAHKGLSALRRKATEKLRNETKRLQELSSWEMERLINELGTHQIELQIQNEELRRALDELEASRHKYTDLYDFAPLGYFSLDEKGRILEVNLTGADMLGVERRCLQGKFLTQFMDKSGQNAFRSHLLDVHATNIAQTCELAIRKHDGGIFCAGLRSIGYEGQPGFRLVMTDVTEARAAREELTKAKAELEGRVQMRTEELSKVNDALEAELAVRRQAEEEVHRALREKETLLREIHHRVKNNLQVISSLLELQAQKIEDAGLREMFQESQRRVKSMALVHEKLYQTKGIEAVDFGDYISAIVGELSSFYGTAGRRIATTIDVKPLSLSLDVAIPCALIINELLTNAYKHAFPGRGDGDVRIAFQETGGSCTLSVADNGVGLPEGFDWRGTSSIGFQLVAVLAKQLQGDAVVVSRGGVAVTITFNRKEVANGKVEDRHCRG